MIGKNIQIEKVTPTVEDGRFPLKRLVGETCVVEADIFTHGTVKIKAVLTWRKKTDSQWKSVPMTEKTNDRWAASFELKENTRYLFQIAASVEEEKISPTLSAELEIVADRPRANFGAWYEMFVRSQSLVANQPGTFKDAEARLSEIKEMGFEVLYLTPIHPIGLSARKGPDNAPTAGPQDPGSPWAIGNEHGGHTAVEPSLGTLGDFDHLVQTANKMNMEIALDLAVQCSPDHPWVKQHPEWFYHRADGSIQYAENPPYEYKDVYPLNFEGETAQPLWQEMKKVVLFWVEHGVKIFRVDNPHSKPFAFWTWLIREIQEKHPEVLFLAEAFTRPKIMKLLSKAGFSQSYTYFIWRNSKHEFIEYMTELTQSGMEDYFRPNFFPTTHDILPPVLQSGGRPAFKMRAALAATLSPNYGIYNGYELLENMAIPGTEEYFHSEKFQIKTRDWNHPGHIKAFITHLNQIRRENPALQQLPNLLFLKTDNDQVLAYLKFNSDKSNILLILVNLDPFHIQEGHVWVPLHEINVRPGGEFEVNELLTGQKFVWKDQNRFSLDPLKDPAHIMRLEKRF